MKHPKKEKKKLYSEEELLELVNLNNEELIKRLKELSPLQKEKLNELLASNDEELREPSDFERQKQQLEIEELKAALEHKKKQHELEYLERKAKIAEQEERVNNQKRQHYFSIIAMSVAGIFGGYLILQGILLGFFLIGLVLMFCALSVASKIYLSEDTVILESK